MATATVRRAVGPITTVTLAMSRSEAQYLLTFIERNAAYGPDGPVTRALRQALTAEGVTEGPRPF